MINRRQVLALVAVGMLAAASPLFAHHSWPVNTSREVTVTGTVTGYSWANPHVMMGLTVKTDSGKVETWEVGGPSIARMSANGWGPKTLKVGDTITAMGYRFTDGQNILRLQKIVMPDGKTMFLYGR